VVLRKLFHTKRHEDARKGKTARIGLFQNFVPFVVKIELQAAMLARRRRNSSQIGDESVVPFSVSMEARRAANYIPRRSAKRSGCCLVSAVVVRELRSSLDGWLRSPGAARRKHLYWSRNGLGIRFPSGCRGTKWYEQPRENIQFISLGLRGQNEAGTHFRRHAQIDNPDITRFCGGHRLLLLVHILKHRLGGPRARKSDSSGPSSSRSRVNHGAAAPASVWEVLNNIGHAHERTLPSS